MPTHQDTVTGNPYTTGGEIPRGVSTADVDAMISQRIRAYDDARLADEKRAADRQVKERWKTYGTMVAVTVVTSVATNIIYHRIRYGRLMPAR